ncbi:Hpt domain-containing protein [Chloroflexi bacterium TSY]|nr:Hpt domain-containing protein [Chloroflexi bacterium TSY]
MNAVAELIGLDEPDFLLELLDTFLTESDQLVANLKKYRADQDPKNLQLTAHSIKSTCATFGALLIAQLSAELETELRDEIGQIDIDAHIEQITQEYASARLVFLQERERLAAMLSED